MTFTNSNIRLIFVCICDDILCVHMHDCLNKDNQKKKKKTEDEIYGEKKSLNFNTNNYKTRMTNLVLTHTFTW